MSNLPGCTVTVGGRGEKCGRPPVHSFESYYGGERFHECARHDSRGALPPLQRVQFDDTTDAHRVDMSQVQQHEIDEWNELFATPRANRKVGR